MSFDLFYYFETLSNTLKCLFLKFLIFFIVCDAEMEKHPKPHFNYTIKEVRRHLHLTVKYSNGHFSRTVDI